MITDCTNPPFPCINSQNLLCFLFLNHISQLNHSYSPQTFIFLEFVLIPFPQSSFSTSHMLRYLHTIWSHISKLSYVMVYRKYKSKHVPMKSPYTMTREAVNGFLHFKGEHVRREQIFKCTNTSSEN